MADLEEFLKSVNPKYVKFKENLEDADVESVEDIAELGDDDFKNLGIKLIPWRKILAAAKAKFANPVAEVYFCLLKNDMY